MDNLTILTGAVCIALVLAIAEAIRLAAEEIKKIIIKEVNRKW